MALNIDLSGQVAIVTGASGGIGLGVARMMAQAGAHVAACARESSPAWEQFQLEQMTSGKMILFTALDITDDESVHRFVQMTVQYFGGIDILVSNAGANVFREAADCDTDAWQRNMDLNLKSHWMMSQSCKPYLERSTNGVIVIMTSNHAIATIPGCFPYNVAKTALTGLVRSLAIEWGPAIRTVGIAPGFIDTPGNDGWFQSFPDPQAERAQTVQRHPVGRLGTPEEIGAFCAFLASSYASFASGATYVVDGGRTALLQD
ncbi:oxidoreductase [Paenibacillus pectinilyticus]|uniref:Oxidoreductase n=1 Tax=Paenibacillus pectinilyticus TaxID=512399 RepID=A0A1C0ZRT6_9BACL|nr:SDR family oxidoreductase [Paenibacillus pectinilyticus]OCT10770.1 oxidoreductase [Paenibacillus pectinilyticus]